MFMTSASCLKNDREEVHSEDGMYEGEQSLLTVYEDVCRNTLGRIEECDVSKYHEVDGNNVGYSGMRYDAWFWVEQGQVVQSLDGTVEMEGILEDHSGGDGREYQFRATGYVSEKSRMGMVIDKVEVY